MESPLLTLFFVSFGFFLTLFALVVESQENVNPGAEFPLSPLPPPPLSPPPPPPPSPHPQPPPRRPRTARSPLLPNWKGPNRNHSPSESWRGKARPPPPAKQKLNLGKKIGLAFVGVVAIMQVGVVAFLFIKRRQLLKNNHRY